MYPILRWVEGKLEKAITGFDVEDVNWSIELKYLKYPSENENPVNYAIGTIYEIKTTYSFHGKPQGTKEIEFKIVVEPNNKNPIEKIFLIGSKTIEKDKDPSKAYLLFEK